MQSPQRYIAHFDLDSFFVSVELLNQPELKGFPVIVGGSRDRGVVTTCSYEARKFGVRSAMPMKQAMQLCPQAILLRGTRGQYSRYSRWVTDIIASKAPLFEKASIDEFYIDLTGMDTYFDILQWTIDLRKQIMDETQLPISFGLSSNKMVSKIATDEAKPNGYLFIQPGREKEFLAPLPVNKFSGVGLQTFSKLKSMGIHLIGDILKYEEKFLEKELGKWGTDLFRYPQLLKHRGAKTTKGVYYGPFASAGAVNRTLNTLQRAFLLRSCSDSVFDSRTRPCLLFQIKRCSAPCVQRIDQPGYHALVAEAEEFLSGKSRAVQGDLKTEMEAAAEALDFERAARLRDRLRAMSHIQASQGVNPSTFDEADLFALHVEGGQTCVQVFFFRAGQNWGNRPYFPKLPFDMEPQDVLEAFIGQFYDERTAPKLLLVSHEMAGAGLMAEALGTSAGHKVEIAVPQRGEKREIMERALTNAREQLGRRMAENSAQTQLLEGVADTFGLETPPRRIEVYDNSHIQGAHALGAFIVAGSDGFEKGQYRKFNIKAADLAPGDDYAMMREVLSRRFARMMKEEGEVEAGDQAGRTANEKWRRPDLVLIDGGPGQLSVAVQVFADLGIEDVALASISKGPDRDAGREHFYLPGKEPFRLDLRSPVLYYLQRLRDEAHRFVIGGHRKKRSAAIGANPLDEIAGVGAARKRALLQHFGSAKAISAASLADLSSIEGVSATLAKKIFDFFHPSG